MIELVTRSQEAIQALHERIWKVVCKVMESAGKSTADSFGNCLTSGRHASIRPLQLTFNTVTAKLPGFTPEALINASSAQHHPGCMMTVLGEEKLKGARGAEQKVMQATWHVTAMDEGLVKAMAIES